MTGARHDRARRALITTPLPADLLYGRLLASAAQHGLAPSAGIRLADGRLEPLPIDRWLADADAVDEQILAGVEAPVLDLGCGPGRHLAALRAAGKRGLGVDLSPVAVEIARGRGADAINTSLWSQDPRPLADDPAARRQHRHRRRADPAAAPRRRAAGARRRDRRRGRPAGRAHAPRPRPAGGAGRRVGVVPVGAGRRRRRRGRRAAAPGSRSTRSARSRAAPS